MAYVLILRNLLLFTDCVGLVGQVIIMTIIITRFYHPTGSSGNRVETQVKACDPHDLAKKQPAIVQFCDTPVPLCVV